MTFEAWMKVVDQKFVTVTGIGRDDWPDALYWDMWDAGIDPIDAVLSVIEDEYGDDGLLAFGLEN